MLFTPWRKAVRKGQSGGAFSMLKNFGIMVIATQLMKPALAEEEQPSAVGVSMSATLIGSISFIMCLYYFINWPDQDIQQKSWETVSSTISIFCAVLLFSSFNDLAEAYVIEPLFGEGETSDGALTVDLCHMLFWFVMMQLALGCLSKATGPWQITDERMEELEKNEEEMEEELEKCEINMACYAVLLAHITGFASINAFGTVQQKWFAGSPHMAFVTVPVAFFFMQCLQRVTDNIRVRISMGDDDKVDEFEEKWDEETEEAENDVMGLTLSFLTINAMRFALTGCLPNQEGKEEECKVEEYLFHHSTYDKVGLVCTGIFFTGLLFVVRMYYPEWLEEEEIEKAYKEEKKQLVEAGMDSKDAKAKLRPKAHNLKVFGRAIEGIVVAIAMCFSWSVFYGLQMILAGSSSYFEGEGELLSVVLALVVSFLLMFGLIPLDWLADQEWTDEKTDKAIRSVMEAMALTIGFAWEQCFDACVDALAVTSNGNKNPFINVHTTKLVLTVFCAGLLVPAWKWYMLPFIVAKGWKFGYVLNTNDLKRVANVMIEQGGEGEEEESAEAKEKKGKQIVKVHEALTETLAKAQVKVRKVTCDFPELTEGGAGEYIALEGDDVAALTQKNKQLAAELEKAKQASLKCQQMLDQTMESMFSSLKQMNVTVTKIEQQQ